MSERGGELAGELVEQTDLSAEQAQRFLPEATRSFTEAVGQGGVHFAALLGGGGRPVEALLGRIDVGALSARAGIDEALARTALERLIPLLTGALQSKAGGTDGILSLLSGEGASGALGSLAGKLFGR